MPNIVVSRPSLNRAMNRARGAPPRGSQPRGVRRPDSRSRRRSRKSWPRRRRLERSPPAKSREHDAGRNRRTSRGAGPSRSRRPPRADRLASLRPARSRSAPRGSRGPSRTLHSWRHAHASTALHACCIQSETCGGKSCEGGARGGSVGTGAPGMSRSEEAPMNDAMPARRKAPTTDRASSAGSRTHQLRPDVRTRDRARIVRTHALTASTSTSHQRVRLPDRSVGLRQDDRAQDHRRVAVADEGRGVDRRVVASRAPARSRDGLPVPRPDAVEKRVGECDPRAGVRRGPQVTTTQRAIDYVDRSAYRSFTTTIRPNFLVACSSASGLPGPSRSSRRCS